MRTRTAALVAVSTVTLSSIPALVGLGPTAAATPPGARELAAVPAAAIHATAVPGAAPLSARRHGQPARGPLPDSGFHPAVGRGRRDADGRDVPGHGVGLLAAALGAVPGALRLLHLPAVTPGHDPSPRATRRPDRRTCSSTPATASSTAVRRRSRAGSPSSGGPPGRPARSTRPPSRSARAARSRCRAGCWWSTGTPRRYVGFVKRLVAVEFRTPTGSYTQVATAVTDATGWVRTTVPASSTGVWRLRYGGSTIAGPATAVGDTVQVVP